MSIGDRQEFRGNSMMADLAHALNFSTLGTTLCSRTASREPGMVDIAQFPGVGKAFVTFFGDYPNAPTTCAVLQSHNIQAVTFLGNGFYKIDFKNNLFPRIGDGSGRYLVTGSLQKPTTPQFLSAADMFYLRTDSANFTLQQTFSSFCIVTKSTSHPSLSAVNARVVNLVIF